MFPYIRPPLKPDHLFLLPTLQVFTAFTRGHNKITLELYSTVDSDPDIDLIVMKQFQDKTQHSHAGHQNTQPVQDTGSETEETLKTQLNLGWVKITFDAFQRQD